MFTSHQKRRLGLQSPMYLLLDWRKVPAASFRLEESLEKVELLSLSMKFKGMSQSSLFSVPIMYMIGAVNISWRVLKCQRLFICCEKQVFQNKKKTRVPSPDFHSSVLPLPSDPNAEEVDVHKAACIITC